MLGDGKHSSDLEMLFNSEFHEEFDTVLIGGAEEPLYRPGGNEGSQHQLFYREDYFSSALHEIAHWCVAGEGRRKELDFGYWYKPDGRSREQQRAFEEVEIKPQALEWIFSTASGIRFLVSADNLSSTDAEAAGPSQQFLNDLEQQVVRYCTCGLPARADRFARALQAFYGTKDPIDAGRYVGQLSR